MAEYVEREPLLAEYDREHEGPPGRARELIVNAPAADVRPVVRARLIKPNPFGECSICGFLIDIRDNFNFCPNCGAIMDKEAKE